MLEYTPVHLAYSRPFMQTAELAKDIQKVDVSADRGDEVVELNLRVDISHLLLVNLFLNIIMLILVISITRK